MKIIDVKNTSYGTSIKGNITKVTQYTNYGRHYYIKMNAQVEKVGVEYAIESYLLPLD